MRTAPRSEDITAWMRIVGPLVDEPVVVALNDTHGRRDLMAGLRVLDIGPMSPGTGPD